MRQIIGAVLAGVLSAIVVAAAVLLLAEPLEERLDRVERVVRGEVIPAIHALKREPERGPEAEFLAELPDKVSRALVLLEAGERRSQARSQALQASLTELRATVDTLSAEPAEPPENKTIADLSRKVARVLSLLDRQGKTLKGQENRIRGMTVVLHSVLKSQTIAARETQRVRASLGELRAGLEPGGRLTEGPGRSAER